MMTPKQIDALPAGTYPISTHPGLRLEVRGRVRTWTLRRRDASGKLKQQVVGHWPSMSLARAAAACEVLRATGTAPTATPKVVTVRAVLRSYIVGHLQPNRKDRGAAPSATLWRHIGDLIDRPAAGVGRADAHTLVQGLAGRVSVQRLMRMELAAAWEWGMAAGLLDEGLNPWQKVKAPPPVSRSRVLSDSEVVRLFKWLSETQMGETTKDGMVLTLATGMRSGEVAAMRWEALDLDKGEYHLRDSKNGLGRVVYLNALAIEVLRRRKEVGVWVFPQRDGRKSVAQHIFVNALYRVRESLGLEGFTLHVLRKTMRTGLARLGVSHEVAELCLGHRLGGVAGIYNLYGYAGEQRAAMALWGNHLVSITTS